MIEQWNNSSYGQQNGGTKTDLWGLSEVQDKINDDPAWFVPSTQEWAAFAGELNIKTYNYTGYGLSDTYWGSYQVNWERASEISFEHGYVSHTFPSYSFSVRLSTTF